MRSAVKKTRLNYSKDDFLMKNFPYFLHKKKAEHSFKLSLSIFCLLTMYFWPWNAELLSWNIYVHRDRAAAIYPSQRFPNASIVKVNIHEHWTRVTRFNPLWVSGSHNLPCRKQRKDPATRVWRNYCRRLHSYITSAYSFQSKNIVDFKIVFFTSSIFPFNLFFTDFDWLSWIWLASCICYLTSRLCNCLIISS